MRWQQIHESFLHPRAPRAAALGRFVLDALGRLCLPQTHAECFGGVFDTADLLNSVWNKDLQDAAQGLRVGYMAMIDRRFLFPGSI